MTVDRLREIPILEGFDEEEVARLAAAGHERRLSAGEYLFYEGERATHFHVVLEGQLETTREVAGEQVLMISHGPGGFLGAMALLTDTPYRGSTCAVAETLVFELDGDELRRLAFTHPSLLRRFLPAIESVSGAVKGVERDREKLLAVGKLAAGLAHELNNPAAAAARAAATLSEYERQRQAAFAEIAGAGAPAEQLAALGSLGAEATEQTAPGERLDPLAQSDREQELARRSRSAAFRTRSRSRPRSRRRGSAASGSSASRRGLATTASPPASASSRPAPARASCSRSSRRRPRASPASSAPSGATPTSTRRRARRWTSTRGSRARSRCWGTSCAPSRSRSSAISTPGCRASRRRAPSSTRSGRT